MTLSVTLRGRSAGPLWRMGRICVPPLPVLDPIDLGSHQPRVPTTTGCCIAISAVAVAVAGAATGGLFAAVALPSSNNDEVLPTVGFGGAVGGLIGTLFGGASWCLGSSQVRALRRLPSPASDLAT